MAATVLMCTMAIGTVSRPASADGLAFCNDGTALASGQHADAGLPYIECDTPSDWESGFTVRIYLADSTATTWEGAGAENPTLPHIRNLLVFPDGFDTGLGEERTVAAISAELHGSLLSFTALGYDVVVVDYRGDGALRPIEENGDGLARLVDTLAVLRTAPAAPIAMIGPSMGGLISTWAVQTLEADGVSPVGLLITVDSPHTGANFPFAYQSLLDFVDDPSLLVVKEKLNSPAALQMLLRHYEGDPDGNSRFSYEPAAEHVSFMEEYHARGVPAIARVVMTSNGACDGQRVQSGNLMFRTVPKYRIKANSGFLGIKVKIKGEVDLQFMGDNRDPGAWSWSDTNSINYVEFMGAKAKFGPRTEYSSWMFDAVATPEIPTGAPIGQQGSQATGIAESWAQRWTQGERVNEYDFAPGGTRDTFGSIESAMDDIELTFMEGIADALEEKPGIEVLNMYRHIGPYAPQHQGHTFIPEFSAFNIDIDSAATPEAMRTVDFGLGNYSYDEVLAESGADRLACQPTGNTYHVVQNDGDLTASDAEVIGQELYMNLATPMPAVGLVVTAEEMSDLVGSNGVYAAWAGSDVPASFTVANTGTALVADIVVETALPFDSACQPETTPTQLEPGESFVVTCTVHLDSDYPGINSATLTVSGQPQVAPALAEVVTAQGSVSFDVKVAAGAASVSIAPTSLPVVAGAANTFVITVFNSGNVILAGTITTPCGPMQVENLAPGASSTFDCVVQADVGTLTVSVDGVLESVGVESEAISINGEYTTQPAGASVELVLGPPSTGAGQLKAEQEVSVPVTVTNTGGLIGNVVIETNFCGTLTGSLEPAQTKTQLCTVHYVSGAQELTASATLFPTPASAEPSTDTASLALNGRGRNNVMWPVGSIGDLAGGCADGKIATEPSLCALPGAAATVTIKQPVLTSDPSSDRQAKVTDLAIVVAGSAPSNSVVLVDYGPCGMWATMARDGRFSYSTTCSVRGDAAFKSAVTARVIDAKSGAQLVATRGEVDYRPKRDSGAAGAVVSVSSEGTLIGTLCVPAKNEKVCPKT